MFPFSDDYECPRICLGNYSEDSWFCLGSPIGNQCKEQQKELKDTAAEIAAKTGVLT